jgi:hypothetical protein
MIEEWRVIEKAINYEISNCGQVRNKNTNKILKPTLNSGYLAISLRINNKTTTAFAHRLVATTFVVCPDETYVVNHKDGNKKNNNVENLEWVSLSENGKHAFRLGLNKGRKIKVSQYTLDDVFIREYESSVDAEKKTGVFNGHISNICRGDRGRKTAGGYIWKYTSYIPTTQPEPDGKTMIGYPNYIITKDGKVYNSQRNKYLSPSKHEGGYMMLSISDGKKRTTFSAHRLVALLFLDNPNSLPEVNHIDFNKTNNNVANLEWVSRSDNMKHNLSKIK